MSDLHEILAVFRQFTDFDERLQAVYEHQEASCCTRLVLKFSTRALTLEAVADDDTIRARCGEHVDGADAVLTPVTGSAPWASLVGQTFQWGWATVNQQGYCDGAMLSFSNLEPMVLINVVASSIRVASIRHEAPTMPGLAISPTKSTEYVPPAELTPRLSTARE